MKLLGKNKWVRKILLLTADCISFVVVSLVLLIFAEKVITELTKVIYNMAILGICVLLFQIAFRTYDSLWRYAEAREYITLFWGTLCGYILYLVIYAFLPRVNNLMPFFMLTVSVCSLLAHLTMRFSYRIYRKYKYGKVNEPKNIKYTAIVGAGNAGVLLSDEMRRNPQSQNDVWCFIDDDIQIIGRKIHGKTIKGPISSIADILQGSPVSEVILAIPSLEDERKQEIINLCSALPYRLKILPDSILNIDKNDLSFSASIRDIKPDDLLGRSCVNFDTEEMKALLNDKIVLVTGGGGSIGSELCRQIARYGPKTLIIFDVFENSSYILLKELEDIYGSNLGFKVEIGSVRDDRRVKSVIKQYRPDIIFHAAAHKHVPLMEHNPGEAVKNNIFPTFNLIKTAALYSCSKFVLISTDKAVNPTNVMGATKRYCEMMIQAMADVPDCVTEYTAVRFGNVLGSSGSVIPLFMNQIERGGPVTITDRRIIRYFMTISEAVSLVLKAGAMAKKSEIFVLNMGKPVKILTLAENLIKLAGFIPYKDIDIVETGLRPGEKLYEELLIKDDTVSATGSEKIFTEKQKSRLSYYDIERGIKLLSDAVKTEDNDIVVAALKDLVPTFRTPEEVNSCVKTISEVQAVVSQTA